LVGVGNGNESTDSILISGEAGKVGFSPFWRRNEA